MSDTKKCPHCEKDISTIALKCEYCGKSLLDDSDSGELATNLYWDGLGGQTKLSDTPVNVETDPLEITRQSVVLKPSVGRQRYLAIATDYVK